MVIMIMTVNRQAIHSFDLYGDDEKKVVVFVTTMLTYQMTTKKVMKTYVCTQQCLIVMTTDNSDACGNQSKL